MSTKDPKKLSVIRFTRQAHCANCLYVKGDEAAFDHALADAIIAKNCGTFVAEVDKPKPILATAQQIAGGMQMATLMDTMAKANQPLLEAITALTNALASKATGKNDGR